MSFIEVVASIFLIMFGTITLSTVMFLHDARKSVRKAEGTLQKVDILLDETTEVARECQIVGSEAKEISRGVHQIIEKVQHMLPDKRLSLGWDMLKGWKKKKK